MIEIILTAICYVAIERAVDEFQRSKNYGKSIKAFLITPLGLVIIPPILAYIFLDDFFRECGRKP